MWKLNVLHFVVSEYFTSVGDKSTQKNINVIQLPFAVCVFLEVGFFSPPPLLLIDLN